MNYKKWQIGAKYKAAEIPQNNIALATYSLPVPYSYFFPGSLRSDKPMHISQDFYAQKVTIPIMKPRVLPIIQNTSMSIVFLRVVYQPISAIEFKVDYQILRAGGQTSHHMFDFSIGYNFQLATKTTE